MGRSKKIIVATKTSESPEEIKRCSHPGCTEARLNPKSCRCGKSKIAHACWLRSHTCGLAGCHSCLWKVILYLLIVSVTHTHLFILVLSIFSTDCRSLAASKQLPKEGADIKEGDHADKEFPSEAEALLDFGADSFTFNGCYQGVSPESRMRDIKEFMRADLYEFKDFAKGGARLLWKREPNKIFRESFAAISEIQASIIVLTVNHTIFNFTLSMHFLLAIYKCGAKTTVDVEYVYPSSSCAYTIEADC